MSIMTGDQLYPAILKELNVLAADIERDAVLGKGAVGKAIKRKSVVTAGTILRLMKAYPQINPEWIDSGRGSILLDNREDKSTTSKIHGKNARSVGHPVDIHTNKGGTSFVETSEGYYLMYAHVVSVAARAGYMRGWGDPEYIESLPVYPAVVKEIHRGHYLWFDVDGDSMDDGTKRSIDDKSKVLGRQIQSSLWRSRLHYNEFPFFVIVHLEYGIMLKEIIDQDVESGIITCHSLNPNKHQNPDFDLRLDECSQIFNVVKIERDARG